MSELSKQVINFRAKHGLSMVKFAELCGISCQTVYNIENKLATPSKITLAKIELAMEELERKEKGE